MLRRLLLATALVGPALLAACDDDGTGPEGTPSVAPVHAYVDADGSGNISAGDQFISGATITLADAGDAFADPITAQTNQFGVALFESLRPGSYTVTMNGANIPAGAVLATSTKPTLVAPFRGDSVAQEFRFVLNPGSIAGRLFRDNNGNDVFDAGDTPAPGIAVTLYAGGEASGEAVATTATDDAGVFTFTTLRPGTYTYSIGALPTMTVEGGAEQTIEVGSGDATAADVEFTGNLISPIGEIRELPEEAGVAVVGVVTVGNNVLNANQFYMQDATGGVLVFGPVTPGTQVGDSVRVVGIIDVFSGETEIVAPPGGALSVTKLGTGTVPAPRTQSLDQVLTGDTEGQLVRMPNVEVVSVSGNATSTAYNVVVQDDDGHEMTIRVAHANVAIPQPTWIVGRAYDVVGLVSMFNGVPQLKPRSLEDVEIRSAGTPIAEVRRMDTGTLVTVEGIATAGVGVFSTNPTSNQFNVQDATGGILVLNVPIASGVQQGDSVRVTATTAISSGEFLLRDNPIIEIIARNRPVPAPSLITAAQVAASGPTTPLQGSLVHVRGVRVDSLGSGATAYNVFVTGADGGKFIVRVSSGVARTAWTAGSLYNVTGTLAAFNAPQIKVRGAADVEAAGETAQTIAEAREVELGDTVTVEGVVTAPQGRLNAANVYIQDATGGIQVFNVPTDMALQLGDLIRVTGAMAQFSGERQIARFSTTSPPVVTKLGTAAVPQPLVLTGAQVLANTFEGQLATVHDVEVLTVQSQSATGTGSYNVTVRAPDGTTFTVRIDNRATGVENAGWVVGAHYDVTGVLGSFNGGGQLKPRFPGDVVRR